MKQISTTTSFRQRVLRAGVALLLILLAAPAAQAQMPETFAYQGFLLDGDGVPVTGAVNLIFSLYDAATGGTPLWQEDQIGVAVAEGIFTVQLGEAASFDGLRFDGSLWLGVRVNGGAELAPRVALSAVPYALGVRGLRVEPVDDPSMDGPSVIGGWRGNQVEEGVVGATIAGGGDPEGSGTPFPNRVMADYGAIGGGRNNTTSGFGATVSGGRDNTAGGGLSTVSGGSGNTASDGWATVSGGLDNTASGHTVTVGGGNSNTATGNATTVGGGNNNIASGNQATVPGGLGNQARGTNSFAAGFYARAAHEGTFVWNDNSRSPTDSLVSTADNQFLIRATGGVGIGTDNPTSPLTVAGIVESTEGGFQFPDGTVQTTAATGDGGTGWQLGGNSGTTTGADFIGTTDGASLEIRVNNARVMRYEPQTTSEGPNVVGGWSGNSVDAGVVGATIAGGGDPKVEGNPRPNRVTGEYGTVGGGVDNTASLFSTIGGGLGNRAIAKSTVGGGEGNTALSNWGTVGGGYYNTASGAITPTVGGGYSNTASGQGATIGGGFSNTASGIRATVAGGEENTASGLRGTVPGGFQNHARGEHSFAAGYYARAAHDGAFVWSDNSLPDADSLVSTAQDQFLIRATGGVGIGTNDPFAPLHLASGTINLINNRLYRETAVVEASDAVLGLYSDSGGNFASAFSFGQISGVQLVSKWTLVQRTEGNDNDDDAHTLQFRFGSQPNYENNASVLDLDGDGSARFVRPGLDNAIDLGRSSRRWKAVYAVNGTIQTSDRRLKRDVAALGYGLPEVMRLRPVSYRWKDDADAGRKVGLIAQEVAAVIPEVVHGVEEAGPLGLNYAELVPVLIKALQDQQDEIKAQRDRIATLEAKTNALVEQLAAHR